MEYHKIHGPSDSFKGNCVAFEKLDGTNLGWEWERALGGFWRSTTRHREFDESDPTFGPAVSIFQSKYASQLHDIFTNDKLFTLADRIKPHFEFFGPKSFAGQHVPGDDFDLVLIDVIVDGDGIIGPSEFEEKFSHLDIPRILYKGKFGGHLIESAKKGLFAARTKEKTTWSPPVNEGIVIKGGRTGNVWMCKVKTESWLRRLSAAHAAGAWTDASGRTHRIDHELREQGVA